MDTGLVLSATELQLMLAVVFFVSLILNRVELMFMDSVYNEDGRRKAGHPSSVPHLFGALNAAIIQEDDDRLREKI